MKILSIDVGIRTLSFCLLEYKDTKDAKDTKETKKTTAGLPICNFYIHFWKVIDILRTNNIFTSNSKAISMPKIIECLDETLDQIVKEVPMIKDINFIIIERQPTGRRASNQKILGLSYCIYTWFHIYFKREENSKTKIELYSSKHKGNVQIQSNNLSDVIYCDKSTGTMKRNKQDYKQRKKQSVDLCWKVFAKLDSTFESHLVYEVMYNWLSKKDDAADACIQGIAYLLQKFVVPIKNKKQRQNKNKKKNGIDSGTIL
jgi:hypothetical protein